MRIISGLGVVFLLSGAMSVDVSGQAVVQVNTVEVSEDQVGAYLSGLKNIIDLYEQILPEAELRVWRDAEGVSPHLITVMTEFPSADAWTAGNAKLQADSVYQQLIEAFEATGRSMVSVTLFSEIIP